MVGGTTDKEKLNIYYIAGFIDGEGCISITKTKKRMAGGSPRYFPYLAISNTNLYILEMLKEKYPIGRKIREVLRKEGNRQCYSVRWDGNELRRFLEDIEPYLIEKKKQAQLVLKFMETLRCKHEHRKKIPKEVEEKREWYYQYLKILKKNPMEANLPIMESLRLK